MFCFIYLCALNVSLVPTEAKRSHVLKELGLIGSCVSVHGYWALNSDSFEEQ